MGPGPLVLALHTMVNLLVLLTFIGLLAHAEGESNGHEHSTTPGVTLVVGVVTRCSARIVMASGSESYDVTGITLGPAPDATRLSINGQRYALRMLMLFQPDEMYTEWRGLICISSA